MTIIKKQQEVYGNIREINHLIKTSESFKSKIKITGKITAASNVKDAKILISLKYLSNFYRTLEIPLINCEINLILTWSENCAISTSTGATWLAMTYTKLYVPVVPFLTEGNVKLLKQLESGFKRKINWNKNQSKLTEQAQNRYLDYLVDPSFQGVNRLFVLSFENKTDREVHTGSYLLKKEIRNFSEKPIKKCSTNIW